MTDEVLITGILSGDHTAYRQLYDRYKEKIYSTAYHYLQDRGDAEELTQDIFVEIFRSAASYNFKASLNTWIYRITVNKCLDKLRYRKAKKRLGVIARFFHEQHDIATTPDYASAQRDEALTTLYKAIDHLPAKQKTALILTQIERLSVKEAAAIMQTTAKAVDSLTQRAKTNLKTFFKKYPPTEGNL